MFRELATVVNSVVIAENTVESVMKAPEIATLVKPGQFINILPSAGWEYVMRRPMSVAGTEGDRISIIYKVVGEGTRLMGEWKVGEEVDIIGPLGNCWSDFDKIPILIGGGVGIAPTLFLHNTLNDQGIEHYLIMGSRTGAEHFLTHSPDDKLLLTTDDGSMGIAGNVIDGLNTIEEDLSKCKLFVCGPAPMMEAVRLVAIDQNIDCDIALETVMACGFGICQGCTMEYASRNGDEKTYRERFGLVCMDGPVFPAKDIKTCYL